MLTAHIVLSHPSAEPEKYSVQHAVKDEVEVGLAKVVAEYARKHGIPMRDVSSEVTWAN